MEISSIESEINVFGFQVKTFPEGVGDAFDSLIEKVPEGLNRSYFGISRMEEDKIIYIAAVEEKDKHEAKKYNSERYTILKGEYLTVTITHWRTKLESIKEVFHEMMKSSAADLRHPWIEWYKNDEEMECMVKCKSPH